MVYKVDGNPQLDTCDWSMYSNILKSIVFYFLGDFGQALWIRSCHEDVILTRKSHNCTGTAFVQGDSAGGSKLIEQTLKTSELKTKEKCKWRQKVVITEGEERWRKNKEKAPVANLQR